MDTMKQARGQRLSDHETVSGTTVHGWPSMAFGMVFVIAGAAVTFFVSSDGSVDAAGRFLGIFCGGIFAVGGLALVAHGLAGVRRMSRLRRERSEHPEEPWRWITAGTRRAPGAAP